MTERALTIDELAHEAGVIVSTVRLYQNKGLLPRPVKQGRVGRYDSSAVGRLRLIGQLQERGFSLAGIKELLDGLDRGETLRAVLGVGDEASTWAPEPPQVMTLAELASALPQLELTPEVVRRAARLELVQLSEDGTTATVRRPFLRIGRQLAELGVPAEVILDQYEALEAEAAAIAGRFTDVFRSHLWEPFVASGMPPARVPELVGSLEELGPLAETAVVMALRHALQRSADRFLAEQAGRLGIEIPRPGAASGDR